MARRAKAAEDVRAADEAEVRAKKVEATRAAKAMTAHSETDVQQGDEKDAMTAHSETDVQQGAKEAAKAHAASAATEGKAAKAKSDAATVANTGAAVAGALGK